MSAVYLYATSAKNPGCRLVMRRLVCSLHPSCYTPDVLTKPCVLCGKQFVRSTFGTHTQVGQIRWFESMSEVSLLIRKQEKKMTEVLVKKTHFTHVEVERLFQIYRWAP